MAVGPTSAEADPQASMTGCAGLVPEANAPPHRGIATGSRSVVHRAAKPQRHRGKRRKCRETVRSGRPAEGQPLCSRSRIASTAARSSLRRLTMGSGMARILRLAEQDVGRRFDRERTMDVYDEELIDSIDRPQLASACGHKQSPS